MDTSERMRTDAWRAVRMTEQRTRMRQNSNTRKLSTSSFYKSSSSFICSGTKIQYNSVTY